MGLSMFYKKIAAAWNYVHLLSITIFIMKIIVEIKDVNKITPIETTIQHSNDIGRVSV